MAKSGNTWFKVKRAKGKRVAFMHTRTIAPAAATMDAAEVARNGFVNRKTAHPRAVRRPTGFRFDNRGAAAAARREAYYRSLGFAA